jgi:hypothetical protein
MIRYPIPHTTSTSTTARVLEELSRLIEAEKPGWLHRASVQTEACRTATCYIPRKKEIWGDVKQVYMKLQYGKCAFCEAKIGDQSFDRIEFDVEHFRPKSKVRQWPTSKLKSELNLSYTFATGDAADLGYYLLPYHPLNYLASCKKCNTNCKSDYFPIAGSRALHLEDWSKLKKEAPFLLYPLGNLDEDPEKLITFQGITPVPVASSGFHYQRARVIIDFFRLAIREDLLFDRAKMICYFHVVLKSRAIIPPKSRKQKELDTDIENICSPQFPHSNCIRAFRHTYETDPQLAEKYYQEARKYLLNIKEK